MVTIENGCKEDIQLIQHLASKVWEPTYREILSSEQLEYMFEMMYSSEALQRQMEEGQHFLICYDDEVPLAFASFQSQPNASKVKIHKLYVLTEAQGKGLGRVLLNEVATHAKAAGIPKITLNVNRYNKAFEFYTKEGFFKAGEEDIHIGNGYLMEDYIMEKLIV